MPPPSSRSYAAVAASTSSVTGSSSSSSFLPPPSSTLPSTSSVPSIDEESFPALGSGGAPLRRRRHWRTVEGGRREAEEGREEEEEAVEQQHRELPSRLSSSSMDVLPPSSSPERPSSIASSSTSSPLSQNPNPQQPSSSAPSAPPPLPHLPIPPRPTLPPSPPTSTSSLGLIYEPSTPRRPLNDSERSHILQVLDVSRDALRRLEQRDQSTEGRIGYLRSQIDAMESLLRAGGTEEEEETTSRRERMDQVEEDGEEAESMLPHSLLTGQMSLLRRRGAIHRNVPNPPLPTAHTLHQLPPHPQLPPPSPSSNSQPPFQPTFSEDSFLDSQHPVRTPSRIRTSPLRSLSGDSNRTSPPVDDPSSLPAQLRPTHIRLTFRRVTGEDRQRSSRSEAQREGGHRLVQPGGSDAKEGGSWRLWCRGPKEEKSSSSSSSKKKKGEKHLRLGPPAEWLEGAGRNEEEEEEGCGALVVREGAVRSPGGLRFESQLAPMGAGKWKGEGEEVRELEGEMGSLGCACEKKLVSCLNCGRILGTYIDASQPYHTHPIYTYASTRVASRFLPSPPSSSSQTTTTSQPQPQPHAHPTSRRPPSPSNPRSPFNLDSNLTAERSFYSHLNRSSHPIQRVVPSPSETDSSDHSLPEIVPVTRRSRLPDEFLGPSQLDVNNLRRHGLSREEANERLQALRSTLGESSSSSANVVVPQNNPLRPPLPPPTTRLAWQLDDVSDTETETEGDDNNFPSSSPEPLATVVGARSRTPPQERHPSGSTPSLNPSYLPPYPTSTRSLPPSSSSSSSSSSQDSEDSLPVLRPRTFPVPVPVPVPRTSDDGSLGNPAFFNALSASVLNGEFLEPTGSTLLAGREREEVEQRVSRGGRECLDLELELESESLRLGSGRGRVRRVGEEGEERGRGRLVGR